MYSRSSICFQGRSQLKTGRPTDVSLYWNLRHFQTNTRVEFTQPIPAFQTRRTPKWCFCIFGCQCPHRKQCCHSECKNTVCSRNTVSPCLVFSVKRLRPHAPLSLTHTGRARKLERFSFDLACVQCGHSHSHQQVPFAWRRVMRPVWIRPYGQETQVSFPMGALKRKMDGGFIFIPILFVLQVGPI